MRLHLLQQLSYYCYVLLGHREFFYLTALIEWKVEEVDMIQRDLIIGTSNTCLATTDKTLDGKNVSCIEVALLLVGKECLDLLVLVGDDAVLGFCKELIETIDEVHEACYFLITYCDVAGCLVSQMHVVVLLNQTADGSAHRDNVIVWVWRKHYDTLWIWFGTLWTIGIVSVWFTTRPTGDRMLQVVENLDISIVCRTIESQQLAQTILVVVLVGKLQDWFVDLLAETNQCRTYQLVCPFA